MADKRMTAQAGNGAPGAESTRSGQFYLPNCDIVERGDELLLLADMPGAKSDQIDIRFENGTLSIDGKVEPRQPADERFWRREYGVGDFHRTFQVGESVDAGKISADYSDGVLTLHLPKAEALKPRKIAVKAGS
jgi:HSP20 family protein